MKPGISTLLSPSGIVSGPEITHRMVTNDARVTIDDSKPSARLMELNANRRRSWAMRWSGLSVRPSTISRRWEARLPCPVPQPRLQETVREPDAPAHLQHHRQIQADDCPDDVQAGQNAELHQQAAERVEVLVLDCLEEVAVPVVVQNVQEDEPEGQRDDDQQQQPSPPALVGAPVRAGQRPGAASEGDAPREALQQPHGATLTARLLTRNAHVGASRLDRNRSSGR